MEPENFLISLLTNFHFYNLLDWQNVQGALFQVGAKVIIYRSRGEASLLGLTLWNLSSFEFKFDDTRLSSYL